MNQWVDSGRTVLVCQYPDGTMTVALRDSSAHTWGPPVTVRREFTSEQVAEFRRLNAEVTE